MSTAGRLRPVPPEEGLNVECRIEGPLMARTWIRLYTEVTTNVKIQRLPDHLFKFLINCWCLTGESENEQLPGVEAIAWRLHIDLEICTAYLSHLASIGLLDGEPESYRPHKWEDRQF